MTTPLFSITVIILTGLAFAGIHSLLSSQRIKNLAYAEGISKQGYRLAYVVIAVIMTAVWLITIHQLPDQPLYSLHGPGQWLCYSLQAGALVLFWLSLRPVDTSAFLGLTAFSRDTEPFIEQGVYRHIRHPMYSSIMIMMLAMPSQSYNSLTLYALVAGYFIIGSRLEEQRMLTDHPGYADYRRRVPAFIPRFKLSG